MIAKRMCEEMNRTDTVVQIFLEASDSLSDQRKREAGDLIMKTYSNDVRTRCCY